MSKRKLYVLANTVWNADDYLNDRNTDPKRVDLYLYASREEAERKAASLDVSDEIYNDCDVFEGDMEEDSILEITGYDSISEFDLALSEPYSTNPQRINFGEDVKALVAARIFENPTDNYSVECSNYDFEKPLDGAVLVFWTWVKYVGYARKCIDVRLAADDDTERILAKRDSVTEIQCDVLLTADEANGACDLKYAVTNALSRSFWKWSNPSFVKTLADEF